MKRNLSVMEIEESNNNNIMADSLRTHELFRSVSEFSSLGESQVKFVIFEIVISHTFDVLDI